MVLRRKEMAVQVSIGQHNAPLCHTLATRAGTSLSSSKTAPTIMASGCSAAELNATKKWSGVLQLTESCPTIINKKSLSAMNTEIHTGHGNNCDLCPQCCRSSTQVVVVLHAQCAAGLK